jgi:hypothetical protein
MLHQSFDDHRDGFLHLVADNGTGQRPDLGRFLFH